MPNTIQHVWRAAADRITGGVEQKNPASSPGLSERWVLTSTYARAHTRSDSFLFYFCVASACVAVCSETTSEKAMLSLSALPVVLRRGSGSILGDVMVLLSGGFLVQFSEMFWFKRVPPEATTRAARSLDFFRRLLSGGGSRFCSCFQLAGLVAASTAAEASNGALKAMLAQGHGAEGGVLDAWLTLSAHKVGAVPVVPVPSRKYRNILYFRKTFFCQTDGVCYRWKGVHIHLASPLLLDLRALLISVTRCGLWSIFVGAWCLMYVCKHT